MIVKSRKVYINEELVPASVRIEGGRIAEILPYESGREAVNFGDAMILPGFIDVHTHGAYGIDCNSAAAEDILRWAAGLLKEGVTGFVPTLSAASFCVLSAVLKNVAAAMKLQAAGAEILGIHMEGPYINAEKAGAQETAAIKDADVLEFAEYCRAAEGLIKIVTLAPEKDKDHALIKWCSEHGVTVSIGHSCASREEAEAAACDGAKSVTHTFNAQSSGVADAALSYPDLYSEIICDLVHVNAENVRRFFERKDKDHAVMVTDSLSCKGFGPGYRFVFGGREAEIAQDESARLVGTVDAGGLARDPSRLGKLAGSTLRMNEGLRNLVKKAGVPFAKAVNACTANPAALLGLSDRKGRIAAGLDADIAVLDGDYDVIAVFRRGALFRP